MEIKIFDDSVKKFIFSLEKPTIAKILRTIDLLEEFGHRLGLPHSKKIDSSIFELRIRGIQEVRILYVFHKHSVTLLYGFMKKSKKIPQKEIKTAIERQKYIDAI